MKKRYQLLLLSTIVLAAYYPAVLAGASRVDDLQLMGAMEQVTGWDLRAIFSPAAAGYYYRPLIVLSYHVDRLVLGLSPGLMHLENILLHLLNVVLVFFLTAHVLRTVRSDNNERFPIPFAAALIFGLHPINAESVNWISGRTDILAGVFVLSSALLFLRYRSSGKGLLLAISIGFCVLGALAKETAVAFIPFFFLLPQAGTQGSFDPGQPEKTRDRSRLVRYTAIMCGALFTVAVVMLMRSLAHASYTNKIGMMLRFVSSDWLHSFLVVLRAFGFYAKKLVLPTPLNFAIMEVDPLYELVAVPVVALCIFGALRRTILSAFFITGLALIAPAFILAFGQIAWMPYAERYLYLSSAFIGVSGVVSLAGKLNRRHAVLAVTAASVILCSMFAITLHRSLLWKNDFALVKDTVEKSPLSRDMRVVYASFLAERGDYDKALEQLRFGSAFNLLGAYDERYDLNYAYIAYGQAKFDEAIRIYSTVLRRTKGTSINALQNMARLLSIKAELSNSVTERRSFQKQRLALKEKLYDISRDPVHHDPHTLYLLGREADLLGEKRKARELFEHLRSTTPPNDPYNVLSGKMITRLDLLGRHGTANDEE